MAVTFRALSHAAYVSYVGLKKISQVVRENMDRLLLGEDSLTDGDSNIHSVPVLSQPVEVLWVNWFLHEERVKFTEFLSDHDGRVGVKSSMVLYEQIHSPTSGIPHGLNPVVR